MRDVTSSMHFYNRPVCVCADTDLKHVSVGVMGVLHNDRMAPWQCVGDAVLAFVAECLPMEKTLFRSYSKEAQLWLGVNSKVSMLRCSQWQGSVTRLIGNILIFKLSITGITAGTSDTGWNSWHPFSLNDIRLYKTSATTTHLWHQRCWDIVDNIRFDPIGFGSLVKGQTTSSATLVSIGQWPIVSVKHKNKVYLIVTLINFNRNIINWFISVVSTLLLGFIGFPGFKTGNDTAFLTGCIFRH